MGTCRCCWRAARAPPRPARGANHHRSQRGGSLGSAGFDRRAPRNSQVSIKNNASFLTVPEQRWVAHSIAGHSAGGGSGEGATMSTRPELPREFVAGHKRRRMMDAVAELTAEQGYEATKIADIVRRAAGARKKLYDNFAGKEALFPPPVDATLGEMRVTVEEACERTDSP